MTGIGTAKTCLRVALKAAAAGAVVCTMSSTLGACYASVSGPDVAVEPAPPEIETYPSIVYEGHPTYFYNNQWYYRGSGGAWNRYRTEPPELARRRGEVVNRPRVNVRANVNVEERGGENRGGERGEERR